MVKTDDHWLLRGRLAHPMSYEAGSSLAVVLPQADYCSILLVLGLCSFVVAWPEILQALDSGGGAGGGDLVVGEKLRISF